MSQIPRRFNLFINIWYYTRNTSLNILGITYIDLYVGIKKYIDDDLDAMKLITADDHKYDIQIKNHIRELLPHKGLSRKSGSNNLLSTAKSQYWRDFIDETTEYNK